MSILNIDLTDMEYRPNFSQIEKKNDQEKP